MKSSAKELEAALYQLSSIDGCEALSYARRAANEISHYFEDVNDGLRSGWESVSKFTWEISNAARTEVDVLKNGMTGFSVETFAGEQVASNAAEETSSSAESILSELNLGGEKEN